jgi:hypothetical protein
LGPTNEEGEVLRCVSRKREGKCLDLFHQRRRESVYICFENERGKVLRSVSRKREGMCLDMFLERDRYEISETEREKGWACSVCFVS